jgi:NADPH2:quinone reductase
MKKAFVMAINSQSKMLEGKDVDLPSPSAGEVQIRHTAIEVNRIDTYHRIGIFKLHNNLGIPGVSAVGVVEAVGDKVKGLNRGDRIVYISQSGGCYSNFRNIEAARIVKIDTALTDQQIAAFFFKACAAHMLVCRAYRVSKGAGILVNGALGGVAGLVTQWCNMLGAYVIGTVSSDEKQEDALALGCHSVVNYNKANWEKEVQKITRNYGVNAVYDAIGKQTFLQCLDCLMDMGIMVQYGNLSGMVSGVDLSILYPRSLFFTRPSVFFYKQKAMEMIVTTEEVLELMAKGDFIVTEAVSFSLSDAQKAHDLLESRTTKKPIILNP